MDPYLEDPGLWPDVHHELISSARAMLNASLRPKYYVRIEERVYVSDEGDPGRSVMIPDLRIALRPGREGTVFVPGGGTATEVAEPIEAITLIDEEIRESYIEVIDREQRLVVTVIEVLSPTNKVAGARGQDSYDRKRLEVMRSPSHFVEIDLLREGIPFPVPETLPPHEYLIHVSPVERRPKGLLWPVRLSQRLPQIPIPLKPEDGSVLLDLQQVLDTAYDRAGYDLEIDYGAAPVPPLHGEWNSWARRLMEEKVTRPS
jgi:hypothetical protein